MIGAPNSLNLNCKVCVMKEAPGPSVSEEIADIFTNYDIDKDYPKTHPLPKYVHTINFMRITKCSPKWYCDGVSHMWRKGMAQRCSVNRQHCEFKAWVFMKSGSAVIDESFHNQFEWAPFTNGVAAEQGTSRPRHRWHRLVEQVRRWCPHAC